MEAIDRFSGDCVVSGKVLVLDFHGSLQQLTGVYT